MWWKIFTGTAIIVLFLLGLAYASFLYERRIYPKLAEHKILGKLPFTFLALSYFILWTLISLFVVLPAILYLTQRIGAFFGIPA